MSNDKTISLKWHDFCSIRLTKKSLSEMSEMSETSDFSTDQTKMVSRKIGQLGHLGHLGHSKKYSKSHLKKRFLFSRRGLIRAGFISTVHGRCFEGGDLLEVGVLIEDSLYLE